VLALAPPALRTEFFRRKPMILLYFSVRSSFSKTQKAIAHPTSKSDKEAIAFPRSNGNGLLD